MFAMTCAKNSDQKIFRLRILEIKSRSSYRRLIIISITWNVLTEPIRPGILSHGPPDEVAKIIFELPYSSSLMIIIEPIVSDVSFFFLIVHFLSLSSIIKFLTLIPFETAYFWAPSPTNILNIKYNRNHTLEDVRVIYLLFKFLQSFSCKLQVDFVSHWFLKQCPS